MEKNILAPVTAATLVALVLGSLTIVPVLVAADYQRKQKSAHYAQQIAEQSGGALIYNEEKRNFYFDVPFVEGKLTPEARACSEVVIYENHTMPLVDKQYSAYSCTLLFEELGSLEAIMSIPTRELVNGEESDRGRKFQQMLEQFDNGNEIHIHSKSFESENSFALDFER